MKSTLQFAQAYNEEILKGQLNPNGKAIEILAKRLEVWMCERELKLITCLNNVMGAAEIYESQPLDLESANHLHNTIINARNYISTL